MTARIDANTVSGDLWTVASIKTSLETLESSGYESIRGSDDLDSFTVVELFDDRVGHVYLLHRDHLQAGTFDVMVDSSVSRESGLAALQRLVGPEEPDFEWISSFAEYSVPRPAENDPSDNYPGDNSGRVTELRSAQRDDGAREHFRKPA